MKASKVTKLLGGCPPYRNAVCPTGSKCAVKRIETWQSDDRINLGGFLLGGNLGFPIPHFIIMTTVLSPLSSAIGESKETYLKASLQTLKTGPVSCFLTVRDQ